jgi:hypothetical protein
LNKNEVLNKVTQIEEQASYALAEFPKGLTKERLQMILALARYLRTSLGHGESGAVGEEVRRQSENDGEVGTA